MNAGLVQSLRARLVQYAKSRGQNPNFVYARYAMERFLYRLSESPHRERFVLKGAMMLLVWLGKSVRPTRDVDLLGYGDLTAAALVATFAEICALEVEPDGMVYDVDSIQVAPIRKDDIYGGFKIGGYKLMTATVSPGTSTVF